MIPETDGICNGGLTDDTEVVNEAENYVEAISSGLHMRDRCLSDNSGLAVKGD